MIQNRNQKHLLCAIVFDCVDCLWLNGLPLIYNTKTSLSFFLSRTFATDLLKQTFVLDVWFSRDCVCFKIEHLSYINEMQAFNTTNVYGNSVGRRKNNELLWVKICSVPNHFNNLSRENFQYTIDDDFFFSLALQLSLTVTNCSLDGLLQTQLKLHSEVHIFAYSIC